jgi:outer membrane protein assembly factor BamB
MRYYLLFLILINLITACGQKTEFLSHWRGPDRDGIYPETGLLKSWPATGPEMTWSFEGLGAGHGSVGFSQDKIFVLGMPDTTGVLYAFDFNGNLLWSKEYGTEWYKNYTGSRSTPTVVGNLVYFVSGQGVAFCYDERTGDQVWSVDLLKTFDAENIQWGITESVLIDGNHVIVTPGGKVHNVAALDRFTGKTVWTSPAMSEQSAYCSPILINHNGTRLFITKTAESVFALNPDNGEMYWSVPQKQRNKIHSNTPVYREGRIFCSSENAPEDNGLVSVLLSEDGKTASVEWRNEQYTNLMGGIILKDAYIYGSEYRKRGWSVTNAFTGEVVHSSDTLGTGVVIWADDRFYCYTEDGKMSLVDAGPGHFNIISSFKVPLGTDQHWAHPVIHGKKLYIRHGDALMVYDIEEKKRS